MVKDNSSGKRQLEEGEGRFPDFMKHCWWRVKYQFQVIYLEQYNKLTHFWPRRCVDGALNDKLSKLEGGVI